MDLGSNSSVPKYIAATRVASLAAIALSVWLTYYSCASFYKRDRLLRRKIDQGYDNLWGEPLLFLHQISSPGGRQSGQGSIAIPISRTLLARIQACSIVFSLVANRAESVSQLAGCAPAAPTSGTPHMHTRRAEVGPLLTTAPPRPQGRL